MFCLDFKILESFESFESLKQLNAFYVIYGLLAVVLVLVLCICYHSISASNYEKREFDEFCAYLDTISALRRLQLEKQRQKENEKEWGGEDSNFDSGRRQYGNMVLRSIRRISYNQ